MKILKIILFFIVSTFSFISFHCLNNPVGVEKNSLNSIVGKVIDQNGEPVKYVDVHYKLYFRKYLFITQDDIKYSLKTPSYIIIKVFNPLGTFAMSQSSSLQQPGDYTDAQDLANFTNGIFHYKVYVVSSYPDVLISQGIFVVSHDYYAQVFGRLPLLQTDKNGNFELPYSVLGINKSYSFSMQSEQQNVEIVDSIKIILYKQNYKPAIIPFQIDTNKSIYKTFVMEKEN